MRLFHVKVSSNGVELFSSNEAVSYESLDSGQIKVMLNGGGYALIKDDYADVFLWTPIEYGSEQ